MKNKHFYLFDLDGTLTDPGLGITKSVRHALESFGVRVSSLEELHPFIGPPLAQSFTELYGFDEEKAKLAVEKYREYFSVTGIYENALYPGIPELLRGLKQSGKKVILATSKPTVFAEKILEHFDIAQYFDCVCGSELDGRRTDKAEVIAYAVAQMNISDLPAAVMVGDRKHDIIGAQKNGIDCIGVLYGYGNLDELRASSPNEIVETVSELSKLLL